MKKKQFIQYFLILAGLILIIQISAIAQTTSPLVQKLYNGGWPSKDEIDKTYDEYFVQSAVNAYLLTIPALNTIGMRDGSEATFGRGYNVLPIWKDRMSAVTLVPTPNCDVIYSMSYLNLKESGPLVVYAPPNVIGMFTDFFQRTLTDVGAAGPDRAAGGLYLLLPPDYDGPIPGGYFTFRSSTYNVLLFFRTVLTAGQNGPDPKPAVEIAERTRVYPLGSREVDRKAMSFPNASPTRINMMYPTDFNYWEKLKTFIDYEPVSCLDQVSRGYLASIGIIKGQPFNPTEHQRKLLTEAVDKAEKEILAVRLNPDGLPMNFYYNDRKYLNVWGGVDANWQSTSYLSVKTRAAFFQIAYSSAPAMQVDAIGMGSKYPNTMQDADGDLLNGNNNYKLHLPPHIPAKLYWAVTAYNATDGTMPETSQNFPSRNQFDKVKTNPDGSIDLYFGPNKPAISPAENWIQTIPNRALLIAVRLYGTEGAFYDQTWKPDDVIKLK